MLFAAMKGLFFLEQRLKGTMVCFVVLGVGLPFREQHEQGSQSRGHRAAAARGDVPKGDGRATSSVGANWAGCRQLGCIPLRYAEVQTTFLEPGPFLGPFKPFTAPCTWWDTELMVCRCMAKATYSLTIC